MKASFSHHECCRRSSAAKCTRSRISAPVPSTSGDLVVAQVGNLRGGRLPHAASGRLTIGRRLNLPYTSSPAALQFPCRGSSRGTPGAAAPTPNRPTYPRAAHPAPPESSAPAVRWTPAARADTARRIAIGRMRSSASRVIATIRAGIAGDPGQRLQNAPIEARRSHAQAALVLAAPSREDCTRAARAQFRQQQRDRLGRILQVGIHGNHDLAACGLEAVPDGQTLALIAFVPDDPHARILPRQLDPAPRRTRRGRRHPRKSIRALPLPLRARESGGHAAPRALPHCGRPAARR